MKKVAPIKLKMFYADTPESLKHLMTTYNYIFAIAQHNLAFKKKSAVDNKSSNKYLLVNQSKQ